MDTISEVVVECLDRLITPFAHAILWSTWKAGSSGSWALFRGWRASGIPLTECLAADLLLMDAEWRHDSSDKQMLASVASITPCERLYAVLAKAANWAEVTHEPANAPVAPVTLSIPTQRAGPDFIRWLQKGGEEKGWSQHGSQTHWNRMGALLEAVESRLVHASTEGAGVLTAAIERFAMDRGRWLKVAGGGKSEVVEHAIRSRTWLAGQVALEFGSFVGYTAARLGDAMRPRGGRCVSIEVDPSQAVISRHLVDLGCLSDTVEVWIGQVRDVLPRIIEEAGAHSVGLIFMDHKGMIFHEDTMALERLGAAVFGAHLVADNVVSPGCPLFLWHVKHSPAWQSTAWALREFLELHIEDWMVVAKLANPRAEEPLPQAPTSWHGLAWFTDHARRRSEGMRPAEGFLQPSDRAYFAQRVRDHYVHAGIEALPWAFRII